MLVIVNDGQGQMCNKLLFQMNVLASAYERGYQVKYYNLQKYSGFSQSEPNLEKHLQVIYSPNKLLYNSIRVLRKVSKKLGLFMKRYIMISGKTQAELNDALENNHFSKHTSYLYGWPFYDLYAVRKNCGLLREYLAPTGDVASYVTDKMNEIRSQYPDAKIIGVHMRRGDYATWRNGAYYYSDAQYRNCMDMMYDAVGRHKQCCFVLFSNEDIDENSFGDAPYAVKQISGSAVQDFHLMSKCDYLMGPPSSFSGLASFLGNIPRYMIEDPNKKYSIEDLYVWLMETDDWGIPLK